MKQTILFFALAIGFCTFSTAQGAYMPEIKVSKVQTLVKDLPLFFKLRILEALDTIPEVKKELPPQPVVVTFREFYFEDTTFLLEVVKINGIVPLDVRNNRLDDISKEDLYNILLDDDKLNVVLVTKKPGSLEDIYAVYLFFDDKESQEWLFGIRKIHRKLTVCEEIKVLALDVFKK